jgi:hypothetical protein
MWKEIWEAIKHFITVAEDNKRNREEIKEVRRQMDEMMRIIERMAYEIRRGLDEEKHEREKLALRLENELLKFERRLPAGKGTEEEK